jgi:hypothetical protein
VLLCLLQEVTSALVQLQREESAAAATAPGGSNAQQQQHEASSPESAVVSPAEQRVRDLVDKYCYLVRTSQTLNPSACTADGVAWAWAFVCVCGGGGGVAGGLHHCSCLITDCSSITAAPVADRAEWLQPRAVCSVCCCWLVWPAVILVGVARCRCHGCALSSFCAGAYCRLFGRHLDTGETLPYNDNHWRNVVAVLGLSKDQVGSGAV